MFIRFCSTNKLVTHRIGHKYHISREATKRHYSQIELVLFADFSFGSLRSIVLGKSTEC